MDKYECYKAEKGQHCDVIKGTESKLTDKKH